MKNVLLIAHAYPPCPEVGSLRPAGLAKYLPTFGWQPIVLTVKLPGIRPNWAPLVETDCTDLLRTWKVSFGFEGARSLHEQLNLPMTQRQDSKPIHTRILSLIRYLVTFPDPIKGWIPFAEQALCDIKTSYKIDAILSTSPPPSAHIIAQKAKHIFGCPWLADFRDLWSENLAQGHDLLRFLERPVERRTLRDADALVTVSEPWADRLRQCYPIKPVFSITNGFDAQDFPSEPEPLTKLFTITYTGRLYEGKRDPTPLFEALQELIGEGVVRPDMVRVRFYGPIEPWLAVLVKSCGLEGVVEISGSVGRKEALRRQQESQILLALCWSDSRETGQHTGKVFEYLGAKRPILAIGGARGVVSDLLEQTRAGVHFLSKEELKRALRSWYAEHVKTGRVLYRGDQQAVDRHSHKEMAEDFAHLLDCMNDSETPDLTDSEAALGASAR